MGRSYLAIMKVTGILFLISASMLWHQNVDCKKYLIEVDGYDDMETEPNYDDYGVSIDGSVHGNNIGHIVDGDNNVNSAAGNHNNENNLKKICPRCPPWPQQCRTLRIRPTCWYRRKF